MESMERRLMLAGAGLAGVAALSRIAKAGPINPPPGPIASTGKTVQEIYDKIARTDAGIAEPRIPVQSLGGSATARYTIDQPGSYYLTANVIGFPGKHAIEIRASGVTLDLCGFTVSQAGLSGISISSAEARVMNGSINSCVDGITGNADVAIFESLHAAGNSRYGFFASGIFRNCSAAGNGDGFVLSNSIAERCTSSRNTGVGFSGSYGTLLQSCVAQENAAGFYVDQRSVATACLARLNTSQGFVVRLGSRAQDCTALENGSDGFSIGAARVESCESRQNGAGFYAGPGAAALLLRCSAAGNQVANYNIFPGNSHGPIANVAGVGDISAVSAASHPWANFSY